MLPPVSLVRRARASLPGKLLAAILVPTVVTFAGFSLLCHIEAQRALEVELGRRLSAVAAAAAAQVPEESLALLSPGDEESRTYRNLRRRLLDLARATGAARVYVFTPDLTSRVDTGEVAIGVRDYALDASRAELRRVFAGQQASSVLFRGRDGGLYKSGFAPVPPASGQAPAYAVGVDGSAALYQDLLQLRRTLIVVGAVNLLAMVVLAVLFGRRVGRPLRLLTSTARTIEKGVLSQPVPAAVLSGGDEVAVLAQGLEAMRQGLFARDERLQMMLSGIAHEVRNPLGGMELFAGLLRDEISGGRPDLEATAGYVARIEREIGHLKAVVSDFLEYARRPPLERAPVELRSLLGEVAESVQAAAPAGVNVELSAPAGLRCLGDATQLRRALLNLGHNAAHACGGRGAAGLVRLSAAIGGGSAGLRPRRVVEIEVRDNGPGIPAEVLPKIWTPFFTTRQKGTGLGLAFVREIIDDHGGQVQVDTGSEGTTFTLALPLVAAGEADGEHPDHR